MSTLIVRDATLAVNGAPESRGEPKVHLRTRVKDLEAFDPRAFQEFVEVLNASAVGEESDPEVLEALLVLGLSQPQMAAHMALSPVSVGRQLAARLERLGEVEHAIAVLELLAEHHPGHRALERDLAALMRRQGLVQDLVDRYHERAQSLLKVGKTAEAIEWLREILLLDRSRKDVARMIRDLRFQEVEDRAGRQRRWKTSFAVLGVSLLGSLLVLREVEVLRTYLELAPAEEQELGSMRARLAAVEAFHTDYPIWHRSLGILSELAELRTEIDELEARALAADERHRAELQQRAEEALLAYGEGRERADGGDLQGALRAFERALNKAPGGWPQRERVLRDVEAIRKELEKQGR